MHPSAERRLFTRLRNEAEGATEDTKPVVVPVACPPSSDLLSPRDDRDSADQNGQQNLSAEPSEKCNFKIPAKSLV